MSSVKITKAFSSAKSRTGAETSPLERMQQRFWTTKQAFVRRFGKDEDECLISSDSKLDEKLEFSEDLAISVLKLLKVLEAYQRANVELAKREDVLGMFLKAASVRDKSKASSLLRNVGTHFSLISKKRSSLEKVIVRLYEQLETFLHQAVGDISETIEHMEQTRTIYRGSLLWMKDISKNLDPEHAAKLKKFRKIQSQVRKNKAKFDECKLKTMQKVDLLAFSRLNMFSKNLATYTKRLSDIFRILSDSSRGLVNAAMAGNMQFPYKDYSSTFDVPTAPSKTPQRNSSKTNLQIADTTDPRSELDVCDVEHENVDETHSGCIAKLIDLDDDSWLPGRNPDQSDFLTGTDLTEDVQSFIPAFTFECTRGQNNGAAMEDKEKSSSLSRESRPTYLPSVLLDTRYNVHQNSNPFTDEPPAMTPVGDRRLLSWFDSVAEFDPLLDHSGNETHENRSNIHEC